MSETKKKKKLYICDIQAMKRQGEKIVLAAPWDFNSTQMAEDAGADMIVIGGGTTAMMLGGQPHALIATMEDVLCLTKQCAPAVKRAVFYVSLPYGSFHVSKQQAVENAIKMVKAGAHCIKAQAPGALKEHA
jgi:3-methyl-2-oxobutanoate hydroxymethyltransferase